MARKCGYLALAGMIWASFGSAGIAKSSDEPAPVALSPVIEAAPVEEGVEVQSAHTTEPLALDEQGDARSDENTDVAEAPEEESQELAKKVANPISSLISVPLQSNFTWGGGVDIPNLPKPLRLINRIPGIGGRKHNLGILGGHGDNKGKGLLNQSVGQRITRFLNVGRQDHRDQAFQYKLNIQPVIPISLNDEWNVISRTILPVYAQHDLIGTSSQGGLGDTLQSFFFSPKRDEPFIWGVGPVILIPTSTDHNLLGSYRWGLGPTAVILKQFHGFTIGGLANHIWGFQRDDGRPNVNSTFLQPFFSYTTKTATTFGISSESTYDWNESQWTVPVIPNVSQIIKIGKLPVNLQFAGQYWVEKPDSGPDWGLRFQMQFLFPK